MGEDMNERVDGPDKRAQPEDALAATIGAKEKRRARAVRRKGDSVWFGLGMFGLVGWSVAVPTLALLALGIWIDRTWPSRYSWTLMLLLLGVGLGCLNAWYWLTRERQAIAQEWEEEAHDGDDG